MGISMKKRTDRFCFANMLSAGAALAMVLCMLAIAAGYAYQWVDGAWNAQVADVFARTGSYAVSYPSPAAFFVPITTGQTVLLPVALLYKLFGVSPVTSAAVPVVYMAGTVVLLLLFLRRFFSAGGMGRGAAAALSAVCAAMCYFFYALYGRYAYQVLGEGAALAFLLLAGVLLSRYARTESPVSAMLCGAMLACALITKTVAVCFLMVFALMILIECLLTRRFSPTLILWLCIGFAAALCMLEALKFIQLGCSVRKYVTWWIDTIHYSFGLSAASAKEETSLLARLTANVQAAADLFAAGQVPALLVMLLIAPACYLVSACARLTKRKDPFAEPDGFALLALGLGGDGFIVAAILFTSQSMFGERRTLLHGVFFLAFVLAIAVECICLALKKRRVWTSAAALLCLYASLCCLPHAASGVEGLVRYDSGEDAQRSRDVYAFSEAVSQLTDARYYAHGWQFAAETMLLNELNLINLEDGAPRYDAAPNHYLLVESYPIETDLSREYLLTPVWQLRPGEETYSIYRIEPIQTKE